MNVRQQSTTLAIPECIRERTQSPKPSRSRQLDPINTDVGLLGIQAVSIHMPVSLSRREVDLLTDYVDTPLGSRQSLQ